MAIGAAAAPVSEPSDDCSPVVVDLRDRDRRPDQCAGTRSCFRRQYDGNVIFLGFWFVPRSGVDLAAALVAFGGFLAGTVAGGRLARHISDVRQWITAALGMEIVMLAVLALLAGTGVLGYHGSNRELLIAGLALTFGAQSATARRFGIQELSTTVLTTTIVGIGFDSRLSGGTGSRVKLRLSVTLARCGGAIVGATLSRVTVAPVIALAAAVVTVTLVIFRFGPSERIQLNANNPGRARS